MIYAILIQFGVVGISFGVIVFLRKTERKTLVKCYKCDTDIADTLIKCYNN